MLYVDDVLDVFLFPYIFIETWDRQLFVHRNRNRDLPLVSLVQLHVFTID